MRQRSSLARLLASAAMTAILAAGLGGCQTMSDITGSISSKPDASADLILAADAMVYVTDLAAVLAEAKRVLATGGLLAFTTETHAGEGVIIGEGLRYAHAATHVCASVEAAGLKLSLLEDLSTRNEGNAPVPGLVVVAAKT